jgi:hypothetical protein
MAEPIVVLRNFVDAPKNVIYLYDVVIFLIQYTPELVRYFVPASQ